MSEKEWDVLDADPREMREWQQLDLSLAKAQELAKEARQRNLEDGSIFSTRVDCSTSGGTLTLGMYEAVNNCCCPGSVAPSCCTLLMTFQWLGTLG